MDELERAIVNRLQGGFPLSERPFADAARELGTDEAALIAKLKAMLAAGTLSPLQALAQTPARFRSRTGSGAPGRWTRTARRVPALQARAKLRLRPYFST